MRSSLKRRGIAGALGEAAEAAAFGHRLRFVAGDRLALELLVFLGDLLHLGLDFLEVVRSDPVLHVEVVVETVLDRRAVGELGVRPDAQDGGGHDVGAGVAEALQVGHLLAFVEGLAVVHGGLLALLGRFFAGSAAPVVLELADIQPAMTGRGMVSRVFRGIERFVLRRIRLLVTTSPGFVREYFEPVQGFSGEIFLLENKVYPGTGLPPARGGTEPAAGGNPWVVGYFGAFRCRRSLELMRELAARLGPEKIRFVLRGYPAGTIAEEFDELSAGLAFGGPYAYPDDLAGMYGGVDFNWAFDESDPSGNSAWLLPNRIYEGACFAVPAIAGRETETGRWIEGNQFGWTFDEPLADSLAAFFTDLGPAEWRRKKEQCAAHPRSEFTGGEDYARLSEKIGELSKVI
jgi:hypothetical protein